MEKDPQEQWWLQEHVQFLPTLQMIQEGVCAPGHEGDQSTLNGCSQQV